MAKDKQKRITGQVYTKHPKGRKVKKGCMAGYTMNLQRKCVKIGKGDADELASYRRRSGIKRRKENIQAAKKSQKEARASGKIWKKKDRSKKRRGAR